jgi:hypothetical protein
VQKQRESFFDRPDLGWDAFFTDGGRNFSDGTRVRMPGRDDQMSLEKFWTPDTIFTTVIGAALAVVLSASLFARPHVSQTGSSLVPPSVLQQVRNQQTECETITDDMDRTLHAHTHC